MINLSMVTKGYKGSVLSQAEPEQYQPTKEELKQQRQKDLYAYVKIEEYNNKMMMYQIWVASMIEKSARTLCTSLENDSICKHKIKKYKNDIFDIVGKLNHSMLYLEKYDLMPVVAHGATAWMTKYDGVGNLKMRVEQCINRETKEQNLIWQSCTHNAVANCASHHQSLMVELYYLNGYCAIAHGLLLSFQDYANDMMQRRVNLKHNSMIFEHCKRISHLAINIINEIGSVDDVALKQNRWWTMAEESLTNICTSIIDDKVLEKINECIFESIKDYCNWYIANTILWYKYNEEINDDVRKDAKKYLTGKGEMMRFVSEIKYLANKSEMQDVYDIIDELPVILADNTKMVSKMLNSIINWAEVEAERIAMKKQQMENLNSK